MEESVVFMVSKLLSCSTVYASFLIFRRDNGIYQALEVLASDNEDSSG